MFRSELPRLTIGLPVYNGDNFLAKAVDAILGQTFTDFELILSDNASTDGTEAMCRAYAERDPRVRYHRNETNLGAAPNYNQTFALSKPTEYFKWAAHDDEMAPTYLEKCIAALDADPDAVLCQSLVALIDDGGATLQVYDSGLSETRTGTRPSERLRPCVLTAHRNTEIFGVIRREAFARTLLHGDFHGCDLVLLAELALQGRFLQVPEPLFRNREHKARYTRATKRWATADWHNTTRRQSRFGKAWPMVVLGFHGAVRRHVPDRLERWRCYAVLPRWWLVGGNSYRSLVDLVCVVSPSAYRSIDRVKARLLRERGEPWVERWLKRPGGAG
jgi:glycosyltransferase involved in cell wall biosynthesis